MAQLSVDMPTLEGHTNSEPEEPHVVSCLLAAGKFTALAFHPLNLQCGTFSFSLSFCVRLSVYLNGFYLGSGNDIFIQINCFFDGHIYCQHHADRWCLHHVNTRTVLTFLVLKGVYI